MSFVLQGLAAGYPWNALLSSTDYYRKQLNETASLATLEAVLSLTYVTTNLIGFAWLNRPFAVTESLSRELGYIRVFYYLNIVTFSLLCVSPWLPRQVSQDHGLFAVVVVAGGILGLTSAFFQHAIFAIAARIGPAMTRAYLLGFAFAGTLASAAAMITRSFADKKETAAYNFGLTLGCLLIGYLVFACRHTSSHVQDQDTPPSSLVDEMDVSAGMETLNPDIAETKIDSPAGLRKALLVIALALAGTLLVFPALIASFKPVSDNQDVHEFTSILFLFFNLGDLAGRGLAVGLSRLSANALLVVVVFRTLSLSFFAFCNRDEEAPSDDDLYLSDTSVIALVFFQGAMSGALFAAAAALAPTHKPSDPGKAGKMVAATIAVALAAGALGGTVLVSAIDV